MTASASSKALRADVNSSRTKLVCAFAAAILLWVVSGARISAALVTTDDPRYGAGSITLDTSTGLLWLDLPLSQGLSWFQAEQAIQPGGLFDGYRHATANEVFKL